MNSKEKSKYRKTKEWTDFRDSLLKERDYTCEICGKRSKKGLNIHHYDEENYTDLQPHKFAVLCRFCHSSLLERKLLSKKDLDIDTFCTKLTDIYMRSNGK